MCYVHVSQFELEKCLDQQYNEKCPESLYFILTPLQAANTRMKYEMVIMYDLCMSFYHYMKPETCYSILTLSTPHTGMKYEIKIN